MSQDNLLLAVHQLAGEVCRLHPPPLPEHLLLWRESCALTSRPSDQDGGGETHKGRPHVTLPEQCCPCVAVSPSSPGPRCAAIWNTSSSGRGKVRMFQEKRFPQKHGHSAEAKAVQKAGLAPSLGLLQRGDRSSGYIPWGNRLL